MQFLRQFMATLILISLCLTGCSDIVDSFDLATDKEFEALVNKLAIESNESDNSVLTLLKSRKTISIDGRQFPAPLPGLIILEKREHISPVFHAPLFNLALYEHRSGKDQYGYFNLSLLLVKKVGKELTPFLIEKLQSQNPETRHLAMELLGKTGDEKTIAPLKDLFLVKGDVQAAVTLQKILKKKTLPILLQGTESDNPEVRTTSCSLLGNLGNTDSFPALEHLLSHDPEATVRAGAAYAMRFVKVKAVVPVLTKALMDTSPIVRLKAAYVLTYKKSNAGTHILISGLETDMDDRVREESVRGLAQIATPGAENALCRFLKKEKVADIRYIAPLALEKNGTPTSLPVLFSALTDTDDRVRKNADSAIEAVVKRHKDESIPILKKLSQQEPEVVRNKAMGLLLSFCKCLKGRIYTKEEIFNCIVKGDIEAVNLFLMNGMAVDIKDTALMYAAYNGRTEIAGLLIESGANVNAGDKYGNTPLMHALRNQDLKMQNLLISKGADTNGFDKE